MSASSASELLSGSIVRRLHHLEITLKSEQIEAAIRLLARGKTIRPRVSENSPGWGEFLIYQIGIAPNGLISELPGFNLGRFDLWGCRELVFTKTPKLNLSPLLAVGLENGVTLRVPTVISSKQLDEYLVGVKSAVRQFYIDFLKDSAVSVRITTETING